ncbi:MAG: respiratory nitrate reductase subunit gamma [Dissulfurispiraceae bacterium]|jgi:nitrate reductase gamma subunit|nr:respiratory nitrate reductase subunit gamma [Dissulfurispiraceae bacterium]
MTFPGLALNMAIYFSALIFFAGMVFRMAGWLAVPNPLKIPTTPAPVTTGGTVFRMLGEVFLFRSLWKADKLLWAAGYIFHLSFLLIIIRHLRYFLYPLPQWFFWFSDMGVYAGFALAASLLYLLSRRLFIDRVSYMSNAADYFYLLLLLLISITGLLMKYIFRTNLIDIKDFILHAAALDPVSMPLGINIFFLVHVFMVLLLAALFPFSKLMHAAGLFITPTRAMVNNARRSRHVNPWADKEWDSMLSKAGDTETYMPWSPEQWKERWKK